jgi:transposase
MLLEKSERTFQEPEKMVAKNVSEKITCPIFPFLQPAMKRLTPEHKNSILLEYRRYSRDHSFAALAARHNIKGGWKVIQRWYRQWKKTPSSLAEKPHPRRPRTLTRQQVKQYVAPLIRAKNRSAESVHYPDIKPTVEEKTGKSMTLRTVQNYGKHDLGAARTRGVKRTAHESACIAA